MKIHLKLFIAILIFGLSGGIAMAKDTILIDEKILQQSDYVDIAYVNGQYAYLIYQTPESLYSSINPALNSSPEIAMTTTHSPTKSTKTAVWLWEYKKIFGHEKEIIDKLVNSRISKIYMQIDAENIESFRPFLNEARSKVEVFALDGKPSDIDDFSDLLTDIEAIKKFNAIDKDVVFAGFQADVEPYIKPDFNIKNIYYSYRYITLINKLKMKMGRELKLSVTIPFWYDTVVVNGSPLSNRIIDNVDEVVIMSYRTQYSEIISCAANELTYAQTAHKPAYLGIETTHLDDEKHYVIEANTVSHYLERTIGGQTILSQTPDSGLPVYKIYNIKADMITFHDKKGEVAQILKKQPDIGSFAGYAIHSYESYIRDYLLPIPNHKDYGIIIDL